MTFLCRWLGHSWRLAYGYPLPLAPLTPARVCVRCGRIEWR